MHKKLWTQSTYIYDKKNFQKSGNRKTYLNVRKDIYDKSTANKTLNAGKNARVFLNSTKKMDIHFHHS